MTRSVSEQLAAEVEAKIAAGEDPLGDNDPLEEVDEGESTNDGGPADQDDTGTGSSTGAGTDGAGPDQAAAEAAAAAAATGADTASQTGGTTQQRDQLDEAALRAVAEEDDLDDEPTLLPVPAGDFKAKQAALDQREAEIDKKWTDGTITDDDRNQQMRQLRVDQAELTREQTRAETIEHINEQRAVEHQSKVLSKLAATSKAAGLLDYSDAKIAVSFDRMLNAVAGDPENAGKSFRDLANLAHEALCAARGVKAKAPEAAAPSAAPAAPRVPPKAPITLRDLPAASTPHTGGSALDAIGNLKGQDYQDAFNRLSPAQQAQLLDA